MFGAVMTIRVIFEQKFYLTKFWSFRLGDSIGFPLFGYFAAGLLQGYKPTECWYDRRITQIIFGLLWGCIGSLNYLQQVQSGGERVGQPSEIYHTTAFSFVGSIITLAFFAILYLKGQVRKKALASLGLLIWVGGVIYDSLTGGVT